MLSIHALASAAKRSVVKVKVKVKVMSYIFSAKIQKAHAPDKVHGQSVALSRSRMAKFGDLGN